MSWVNKAGLTMLLLAMEHATSATDKKWVAVGVGGSLKGYNMRMISSAA